MKMEQLTFKEFKSSFEKRVNEGKLKRGPGAFFNHDISTAYDYYSENYKKNYKETWEDFNEWKKNYKAKPFKLDRPSKIKR